MAREVLLTRDAARDLELLHDYIARHDSPEKAEYVLGKIEAALVRLGDLPHRGAHPRELLALGIKQYREVFFKPYRLIYQVMDDRVYVMLMVDGRRDMQTLLERRLLER
ncbi:MAG: type II toxin-antitoxin system RelE/ParE family toxin [Desulfarculaceae bacterium]|nr:type II toxin-antitoxin system RelE/ParE family toxin [Desulfarculaceae bacterium]MCF8070804.1 type II toxin-antitoxin system RelE/ParE family toxin [Desulfarculaceae bacterium]MCF8102241.1 type II toxin-antitoxin system RelE/ParE family toxin [Desulfarculaceae bacterium]MCF8117697.1 type II toxin-antitoxin system RelE/ParE family toxin [Desulfarculaceae bacterium]